MASCSRPETPNSGIMGQSPPYYVTSPPPTPGNNAQSPQGNVSPPPGSPGIMDQGQFNMSLPSSVGSSAPPGTPESANSSKNNFPNRHDRSPDYITLEEARAQMAASYAKGVADGKAQSDANHQAAGSPQPSTSAQAAANYQAQVANIPPGVPVVFDRNSPVACPYNIVASPQSIPVVYDTNSTVVCPMNAVPVRVKQNAQTSGNMNMMCSCSPVSGAGGGTPGGIMNTSMVSLASSGSPGGIMGMTPPAGYASPYFSPSLLPGVQTPVAHWLYGNNLMGHDTPPSLSPFGQVRSPGFANPLDPYAGNLMNLMQSPLQPQQDPAQQYAQAQAQQQQAQAAAAAQAQGQGGSCVNPNLRNTNRRAG